MHKYYLSEKYSNNTKVKQLNFIIFNLISFEHFQKAAKEKLITLEL